MLIEIILW